MKVFYSLVLTILLLGGEASVASEVASGFCAGCSPSAKMNMAMNWANRNISSQEAMQGVRKRYNVIDSESEAVTSFEVYKVAEHIHHGYPSGYIYIPRAEEVSADSETFRKVQSLFYDLEDLSAAVDTIEIPKSVIEDAWEVTGCAYCENEITDYLREHGNVSTLMSRVENVLQWLNAVDGKLNEVWVLTLESGGEIQVEVDLIHADEIIEVTIIKVTDPNNNDVPLKSSELSGLVLQGSYSNYYSSVEHYLHIFGFKFEEVNGRVTVRECRMPGDAPSNKPKCNPAQP